MFEKINGKYKIILVSNLYSKEMIIGKNLVEEPKMKHIIRWIL